MSQFQHLYRPAPKPEYFGHLKVFVVMAEVVVRAFVHLYAFLKATLFEEEMAKLLVDVSDERMDAEQIRDLIDEEAPIFFQLVTTLQLCMRSSASNHLISTSTEVADEKLDECKKRG